MAYTINHYITDWVEESRALMQPDKVLWIDGTETQLEELRRAFGEVDARETTLGYEPYPEDIDLEGSGVTKETLADLLSVDPELWKAECKGIHEFYAKFGDKLPQRLADELSALEARLG